MPVYKDKKRGTWYVRFKYKDWMGKTVSFWKRGFATKREAVQYELDYKSKQRGTLNMTFGQFVELYKEDRANRIKESTMETKSNIINLHITPYFASKKISDITPADVIKWQNTIICKKDNNGKRFSKSFLKTIHNQLSAIMNHAVKFYGLTSNPAAAVGNMGTDKEVEINFWTSEQYKRFSEEMLCEPMYYVCFEILYWCGIREGELLALTQQDIDFKRKTININKTFQHIKGRYIVTEPKTRKSKRSVIMPEFLCEEIKEYIELVYKPSKDGRLFQATKGTLTSAMKRGIKRANLPHIRIHDLRHSHVSLLIDMGYSAVAIAERVGHETTETTYRYAHLFPSVQSDMANKLNSINKGDQL